ncbi:hypothetical protein P7K49_020091 [Saguinus oedipus]|uniref:Uncharacterized protein n=1 Tax=Saguinus oedipus TaxID=9490 RepID=A0ABQ9UZ90_SAGOE|nr:hypothetical protein P7K49_020091 [Saguinus oedipus]
MRTKQINFDHDFHSWHLGTPELLRTLAVVLEEATLKPTTPGFPDATAIFVDFSSHTDVTPHLMVQGKRILASLGDRLHDDPPQKPPRSITLREPSGNHTPPQLSPSLSQSTYTTGGSLDVPHIIMQGDARRRRNENYFDDIPRSKLERQMAQEMAMLGLWRIFYRKGMENIGETRKE